MALFWRQIGTGLAALNAVTTELGPVDLNNINELTFYVVGGAGIASGAVQAEEAHVEGYTGTWAPNGSPVTVAASSIKTIKVTGVSKHARVRVSTLVSGGTVDVYALGR